MSTHALDVRDADVAVGRLEFDAAEDTFSFAYAKTWLERPLAYPLSPHFPLRANAPVASATIRRFIANLLPEGRALDIVATTHRIARTLVFGLIRELGRETTGALAFVPAGEAPAAHSGVLREVTHAELAARIADRASVPFSVWDGRVRLSIAGFQDKLAAYLDGDRIYLAEGALASTHILKPEPLNSNVPKLVANEHYCMRLATGLGVACAPVRIMRVPDPVLVIERFDRSREAHAVRRIHIIDACQALDLPVDYKYERNFGNGRDVRTIRDGVGFARLFSTLQYVTERARAAQQLTRWAIVNFLIGNTDAHGKNVSFFSQPQGLAVGPFYDIVSTVQYSSLEPELAMAFGDEFELDAVSPFALADFAHRANVPRTALVREMRRMAQRVQRIAPSLTEGPEYIAEERAMVAQIAAFACRQADRLLAMAASTLEVDPALLR